MRKLSLLLIYLLVELMVGCSETSKSDSLVVFKTIEYKNGLFRKGYFLNDIPINSHRYFMNDSLIKVINYINWNKEFVEYIEEMSEKIDIPKLDSADLFGYPNVELFIDKNNSINKDKSNFVAYSVNSDTSIHINVNISKYNTWNGEKWVHLFIFRDDDVRYIVKKSFDFSFVLTEQDIQKIKSQDYKIFCMTALVGEKLKYSYSIPINLGKIKDDLLKDLKVR